jgi:hypothetical protein
MNAALVSHFIGVIWGVSMDSTEIQLLSVMPVVAV